MLYLSEKTVRNHISIIYSKLEVKDRFEIIRMANQR
jgi:DNA-binding NarL/FixJ family response regulator